MAGYSSHFSVRRLWAILAASMLVMFRTLLYFGREIYQAAPPIPATGAYHWPFMFFGAVLVWNLIHAGLLGFLINPPLALYYMQGLNTTARHGHAALFGVYGMLGLGLMLFCMRGAEVIQGPVMQALVWARVPGDLVFACGMPTFAAFVVQAFAGRRANAQAEAAAAILAPP